MNKRRAILLSSAVIFVVAAGVALPLLSAKKKRAQSMSCVSNMVSICFAGRLYALDRDGHFPTNFICMSNELVTCKVLACPADKEIKRTSAGDWASCTDANCSYVMVTPGVHEDATNTVFVRCSVHGHLGYPDNTVFDGQRRRGKSL